MANGNAGANSNGPIREPEFANQGRPKERPNAARQAPIQKPPQPPAAPPPKKRGN